jgi:hypothetical protein
MIEKTTTNEPVQAWRAVAQWYHAYFTGIVLYTVSRRGADEAARLVYEIFSRQRHERFLPGLRKLGLEQLPHAMAAAQYHYLSNQIGGVSVEYMPESNRKAWIRYAAPRWIWSGTALCGIPPKVSTAMLEGWHAQNGVMLQNPRLGFVCTKQTVDGQAGLEGYYYEYDQELAPHERLRFARDEEAPEFDAQLAPVLPIDTWPPSRLAKAHRNYAMEYVKSTFPTALQLWGPDEAEHHLRMAGKLIGMQFYHETAQSLNGDYGRDAFGFARFIADLGAAHGDKTTFANTGTSFRVNQEGWALMDGIDDTACVLASAWNGLLEGAMQAHNHRLHLSFSHERSAQHWSLSWQIKA